MSFLKRQNFLNSLILNFEIAKAFILRPQVPITIELPAALTVAEGESVTVTLNYDPSAVDCADDVSISTPISAMTATATKE